MKCELCHQGEAETVIWKKIGQTKRELYVCSACAAKERGRPEMSKMSGFAWDVASLPQWCKKAIMGILQQCLKGMPVEQDPSLRSAFSIEGHPEKNPAGELFDPSCPICGITRHEYRKAGRLGCPFCYQAFAAELDADIFELQGFRTHRGKKPPQANPPDSGLGKEGRGNEL